MAKSPILYPPTNPHFFKPLLPGFHAHLRIPVAFFSAHIKGLYERNTAKLRSNAFDKTWNVRLEGRRLTDGWEDFAVAHDLRIGDFVFFKYEGDLVFFVTAFGPSCCEIQYLHSRNSSIDQNVKTESLSDDEKDSTESESVDGTDNIGTLSGEEKQKNKIDPEAGSSSSDNSCFVSHITDSNLQVDTLFLPKKLITSGGLKREDRRIILKNKQGRTWEANLRYRESSKSFYITSGWRSFCQENGLKSGNSITWKLENKETPLLTYLTTEFNNAHQQKIISRKRRREMRKNSSAFLFKGEEKDNRFVTLCNHKSCRVYFPMRFSRANEMEKAGRKIILVDKDGVKWHATLLTEKVYKRVFLGKGWREFCEVNQVQMDESVVMEFLWEDKTVAPILKFCSKV